MNYPIPSKNVRAAMDAAISINVWQCVIAILESGAFNGGDEKAKSRIIKIAKSQQQKALKQMDRAVTATNKGAP